jgi:hypothetical protein
MERGSKFLSLTRTEDPLVAAGHLLSAERDRTRLCRVPHLEGRPTLSLVDRLVSCSSVSRMEEELMRRIILAALITCFAVGTAAAQSCDSQAVSAGGKPLHGAAKMNFVKKCKRDACGSKAVSADGKPLHGAAKNSFMTKCMRTA